MTVTEIIALCHAGYNSDQIMQLAQAQQMERAQQPAAPIQAEQQMERAAQPAAPVQAAQPTADPYSAIMAELLGLKQAVQATNMMATQQPVQPMAADDIIANIIAPRPRKED